MMRNSADTAMVHDNVTVAAQELVARHRREAVGIMATRIAALAGEGRWPEHDVAQRVLSVVEKLLAIP